MKQQPQARATQEGLNVARKRKRKERVSLMDQYIHSVIDHYTAGRPKQLTECERMTVSSLHSGFCTDVGTPSVNNNALHWNLDKLSNGKSVYDSWMLTCQDWNSVERITDPMTVTRMDQQYRLPRLRRSLTRSDLAQNPQHLWLLIVEMLRDEIRSARERNRAAKTLPQREYTVQNPNSKQREIAEVSVIPCSLCSRDPKKAVAATICGHFLCWDCLCQWHQKDCTGSSKRECPCCNKVLAKSQVSFIGEKSDKESSNWNMDGSAKSAPARDSCLDTNDPSWPLNDPVDLPIPNPDDPTHLASWLDSLCELPSQFSSMDDESMVTSLQTVLTSAYSGQKIYQSCTLINGAEGERELGQGYELIATGLEDGTEMRNGSMEDYALTEIIPQPFEITEWNSAHEDLWLIGERNQQKNHGATIDKAEESSQCFWLDRLMAITDNAKAQAPGPEYVHMGNDGLNSLNLQMDNGSSNINDGINTTVDATNFLQERMRMFSSLAIEEADQTMGELPTEYNTNLDSIFDGTWDWSL